MLNLFIYFKIHNFIKTLITKFQPQKQTYLIIKLDYINNPTSY